MLNVRAWGDILHRGRFVTVDERSSLIRRDFHNGGDYNYRQYNVSARRIYYGGTYFCDTGRPSQQDAVA